MVKPFAPLAAWVQQIYLSQCSGDPFEGLTKVAVAVEGYSKMIK
jgi:hypothetical protein